MFKFVVAALFVVFWVWVRRRQQASAAETQHLDSELFRTQRELEESQRQNRHVLGFLDALHEHRVSPTGKASWQGLSDFAVQNASLLMQAGTVVLLRQDPLTFEFHGVSARGLSPEQLAQLRVRMGEGALGRAAEDGKVTAVKTSTEAPDKHTTAFLTPPYAIVPLCAGSQVQGLLVFAQMKGGALTPDALRLAEVLAKHLELTMENVSLHEDRERVYGEWVSALRQALSAKDPAGRAHADQCRELVRKMAKELHLPAMLTEQIEYGAVLHDVGKLGVSEALLNKPGPLSAEEYAAVKKHASIGHQILREVDFLKAVAPIVLYHHEWVNGQGYPEGLAGEEIPLGARMVSIVEAWDTMTHDQPYRAALSKNSALAELRQQAGTQFDPRLVDVFVRAIDPVERHTVKAAIPAAPPNV